MGSHSPLQIALWIVSGLAAIGVVVTYLRTRMTYAGYEDIIGDIRKLGTSIKGDVFRDGADVVVSGAWEKNPVVVRFSNQENTPGLNMRMPAAATFQLSVAAAGQQLTEGPRTPVKTADDMFDARFTTRTDQPMNARMLLTKNVTATLQRLACSKNTYVAIGGGLIEQSELVIPSPDTARHVMEHLKAMASLAGSLRALPGAEKVKLYTIQHERHVLARAVMAVGVFVAVASIIAAMQVPPRAAESGANDSLANGIMPIDVNFINGANRWHAATVNDLDPGGVEMLRTYGVEASGRVPGDYSGTDNHQDVAYLLINDQNKRRVVIIAGHQNKYDAMYPSIGLIARVPKNALESIQWKGGGPGSVDADGLLLVRQPEDPESGVVIFVNSDGVKSALPKSWHDVPVK